MNYKKLYQKIIDNRKVNNITGYTEKHHIIPKSLGGTNDQDNLVRLTAREHFICHYLLAKMYPKESFEWYKMQYAFNMMKVSSCCNQRYFNARLYEALRKDFALTVSMNTSKTQQGKNNSQYGTIWISNIELKQNKKIKRTDSIPKDWVAGKNAWNNLCETCGTYLNGRRARFCEPCKPKPKGYTHKEKHSKELFFTAYNEHLETQIPLSVVGVKYGFNKRTIHDYKKRYVRS